MAKATKKRKKLTPAQRRMVQQIRALTEDKKFPPTIRELAAALGYDSANAVSGILLRLVREGYVTREEGKPRSLCVQPWVR